MVNKKSKQTCLPPWIPQKKKKKKKKGKACAEPCSTVASATGTCSELGDTSLSNGTILSRNDLAEVHIVHCDDDMCEIEASVCSGLEEMAKEEMAEKLGGTVSTCRGRANVFVPISQVKKTLELRGVDNLMVVAGRFRNVKFSDNLPEALEQIKSFVPLVDWKSGLAVWNQFFTLSHPISHLPASGPQGDNAFTNNLSKLTVADDEQIKNNNQDPASIAQESKGSAATVDETCDKPTDKRPKRPGMPSFRATCYRTGEKHSFQSPQAAAAFGGTVNDYLGWNVDLQKFDIEIVLCIDDDDVRVCLTLTKESLHRRDIVKFGPTTLRPTIAHGMLRMCKIQQGDVVCDPMCGGGSISVESAISWPKARNICGDISDQCTSRARNNVNGVNEKCRLKQRPGIHVDITQWDASQLPLTDQYVDVFISDMPFGKRSGSKMSNWQLYPKVLHEMARVCKVSTGRACLLTHDRKCMAKSLQAVSTLWRRGPTVGINIGGLASCIYVLYRTATPFNKTVEPPQPAT